MVHSPHDNTIDNQPPLCDEPTNISGQLPFRSVRIRGLRPGTSVAKGLGVGPVRALREETVEPVGPVRVGRNHTRSAVRPRSCTSIERT